MKEFTSRGMAAEIVKEINIIDTYNKYYTYKKNYQF